MHHRTTTTPPLELAEGLNPMNCTAETVPTVRSMTQEQATKLAAFIVTIRPEWSAAPIRGLLQAHTYGYRGLEVTGAAELTRRTVAAAFTSTQEQLTELPGEPAKSTA
jgi:hypothetical protein